MPTPIVKASSQVRASIERVNAETNSTCAANWASVANILGLSINSQTSVNASGAARRSATGEICMCAEAPGLSFTSTAARKRPPAGAIHAVAKVGYALAVATRTLLIVEDDDDLRRLYLTALRAAGYDVLEAATGLDALRRIDAQPPDLIVLDLMLPKVSGFGVLYDLSAQAHTRSIPVIVVTGTSEPVESPRVACVLRKPVDPDDLIAAIERCLASGTPAPAVG